MGLTALLHRPMVVFYASVLRRGLNDTWLFAKSQALLESAFAIGGPVMAALLGAPLHIAVLPLAGVGLVVVVALVFNMACAPFTLYQEHTKMLDQENQRLAQALQVEQSPRSS